MSSSMTSSAAALLGGLTAKPADKPDTSATPATTRPGDSKSVLASSTAMKSSAASSLGALFAKQSDARPEEASMASIQEDGKLALVPLSHSHAFLGCKHLEV
ncbi:unnamed protein product [Effrenium voratum]|nr:unnamed protein product [Effrenium voratum]